MTQTSRALLVLILLVTILWPAPPAVAQQVRDGATLTVLRGQVAIVRPDGSAVQPAPSGALVNAGDEIRTLSSTGALITFFVGTEIELGEETILVVDRVTRQGERVDVSLKQVLGATVSRVQTLGDPGSAYRVEAGGAVALVRGTTFAVIGPVPTSVGNLVVIVCLDDCTPSSTFAGCPLGPYVGYGVEVERGRVTTGCVPFAVSRSGGLFNAAFEGITTVEQALQGDTRGVPAGQVAAGQRQETANRIDRERREREEEKNDDEPLVSVTPPFSGPAAPCNQASNSGGAGVTTTVHQLGRAGGTFTFSYNAFAVPDRFDITYEGRQIFSTGGFVSGSASVSIPYSGSSTVITVVVTGSSPGTAWTYTVGCPS